MRPTIREDLGLLALRASVGGVLFAHGAQKLFGWFGGQGPSGTAEAMEAMGFTPGRPSALAAGAAEAGGGTLLALGLATPAAGAAAAGAMAAAVAVHAPAGFFASAGGLEYPALLGCAAAALAVAGPGRFSLDRLTGHRLDRPWLAALSCAAGASAAGWAVRRRAAGLRARPDAGAEEEEPVMAGIA